jgi:threonine dehydratase
MSTTPSQTHIFVGHDMIRQAEARLKPFVRETGVERALLLESGDGCAWLKLELQQITGSFKVRGALNAVSALAEGSQAAAAGVVACSAGNHALGVAFAAQVCGFPAQLFVPESIDPARKRALEHYPVELAIVRGGYGDAERAAMSAAASSKRAFVSPYNDPHVVAGQGTVAAELMRQLPDLDAIFVAVGGGGLLAGIGSYARAVNPEIEIVAVSPARSPVMCDLLAGRTAPLFGHVQTLSDSTAGDIEPLSITVGLCRALISRWVLLAEEEIVAAMKYLFYEHRLVTEGAGALAVAAYMKERARYQDKNCALVVCGGNIEAERFLKLIQPA